MDNNAETRECEASLARRKELAAAHTLGNPSSSAVHEEGRIAKRVLEDARSAIMRECDAPGLVFTSGATESNHLAIAAGVNAALAAAPGAGRVVITPFEHASVERVAEAYSPMRVRLLPGGTGEIDSADLRRLCAEPDVGLVSLILAHNELGVVQPMRALRDAVLAARRDRESSLLPIFHLDATQLLGKARFSFAEAGADLASWSAHKFHGPGGVGGLFTSADPHAVLMPQPLCCAASGDPGGQERGMRAGTENAVGAACAAAALVAVDDVGDRRGAWERTRRSCDDLARSLAKSGFVLNAYPSMSTQHPDSARLCNTVHLSCLGSDSGLDVAARLDERWGVAVSTGSACSKSAPSRALSAAGFSSGRVRGALRVSLSPIDPLSRDDAERVVRAFVASSQ